MEGATSALKLTTASYWRPSGKNIHRFPDSKKDDDWGVKPDIEVKLDIKELIEYFKYRRVKDVLHKPGSKLTKEEKEILKFEDRVLEKAKEVILKEIKGSKKNAGAPAPAKLKQAANPPGKLKSAGQITKQMLWCIEEATPMPSLLEGLCRMEPQRDSPCMAALPWAETLPTVVAAATLKV
jgi:carboxyl-terminal processing protease